MTEPPQEQAEQIAVAAGCLSFGIWEIFSTLAGLAIAAALWRLLS